MLKNIIIGIFAVGIICAVFLLDIPKFQSISDLNNILTDKEQNLKDKQDLIARVEKLIDGYNQNQEILKKIDYILPNNSDIPNLIVQIEALAKESGMNLGAVDFKIIEEKISGKAQEVRSGGTKTEATKDYHTMNISISVAGDYAAFKNFLRAIEENIRLMDVQSVNFSSGAAEGAKAGIFEFDINLQTYYKP